MVDEQSESEYGTTVRAFAFDGDEAKYRSWEEKTKKQKKTKYQFTVLPRRSLRGDRHTRLDITLSDKITSSNFAAICQIYRTGAK